MFDVNALIAFFDPSHPDHRAARIWAGAQARLRWASCPIAQNGYLRICLQPRYASPVAIATALQRLRTAIAETDQEFWPDDVSPLDDAVIRWRNNLGHRRVMDAHLLALAVKRGGKLAAFDRGAPLSPAIGATADHLVTLAQ